MTYTWQNFLSELLFDNWPPLLFLLCVFCMHVCTCMYMYVQIYISKTSGVTSSKCPWIIYFQPLHRSLQSIYNLGMRFTLLLTQGSSFTEMALYCFPTWSYTILHIMGVYSIALWHGNNYMVFQLLLVFPSVIWTLPYCLVNNIIYTCCCKQNHSCLANKILIRWWLGSGVASVPRHHHH